MEELDAIGIAAVFAADTQFQVGIGLTAVLRRHTHQLADAVAVDGLERVDGKYLDFPLDAWLRHRGVGWAADLIPNLPNMEPLP